MVRAWLLAMVAAVGILAVACEEGGEPSPTPTPTPDEFVTELADLVRAVVRVEALVQTGDTFEAVASGSGTIISASGLILTNYHVAYVDGDLDGIPDVDFDRLGISVTDSPDTPPEPTFFAEVITADRALDLAVLRIVADADGNPVDPKDLRLPIVRISDPDTVNIGGEVVIIGYPDIGGENVTVTSGRLSSFEAEEGIGRRAWIETDALISYGNSGGGVFDAEGQLVAVPTEFGPSNVVGLSLSRLRPVALADELIEAALAGRRSIFRTTQEPGEEPTVPPGPLQEPVFSPYTFALGVDADGLPADVVDTVPGGLDTFYVFADYAGMTDGVSVAYYCINTDEQADYGPPDFYTWEFGSEGTIYFSCATEDGSPLPPGPYDIFVTTLDEAREEIILVDNDPAVDVVVGEQATGGPEFGPYTFALDVDADGFPVDVVDTVPAGVSVFLVFVDYAGMTDGVSVGLYCIHTDSGTDYGEPEYITWEFGSAGTVWATCFTADDSPLPSGAYDIFITMLDEEAGDEILLVDNDPVVDVFVE